MENYDPGNMFSSPLDLVASNTFIMYGNLGKPSILGFAYGQRCAQDIVRSQLSPQLSYYSIINIFVIVVLNVLMGKIPNHHGLFYY